MTTEFYSCGKLLITGEYLILRGARGLALPTSRGQRMRVEPDDSQLLSWKAYDQEGACWFEADIRPSDLSCLRSSDAAKADKLCRVLGQAREMAPEFLSAPQGYAVRCALEFARDWGLGTSSTLVRNIAAWAGVDPYRLQVEALGGSGYDVMVAEHACPIVFSRDAAGADVREVSFAPDYSERLWFVHCGQKQDSAQEVTRFSEIQVAARDIDQVSRLSDEVLEAKDLGAFERLLSEHDLLLSRILARPSASEVYPDFTGMVKYLGAWGGDFMLATGSAADMDYFRTRGMETIRSYKDMIAL